MHQSGSISRANIRKTFVENRTFLTILYLSFVRLSPSEPAPLAMMNIPLDACSPLEPPLGKSFTHTHLCSPSGINWYRPRAVTLWSWEGNRILLLICPFHGAIAVPSVTRCRCCRCCCCGHRFHIAIHQVSLLSYRLILVVVSTVATPGEWQCKIRTGGVRRLAVANGPNIFQMLLI